MSYVFQTGFAYALAAPEEQPRETSRSMAEIEIPPYARNDRLDVMSYVFQTGFAYALAVPKEQQRETS